MINFDDVTKENIKNNNRNWPQIPDHPYRILIIGGPGSGKTDLLFKKREDSRTKHLNDSKVFIEYSNDMDDIYENIEEYNPNKKRKILIVFNDMIADMHINKKLNSIVIEFLLEI